MSNDKAVAIGKLAVLELDGALEHQELSVKLKIGGEGEALSAGETGTLPPNPKLASCLQRWQRAYRSLVMLHHNDPNETQQLAAELCGRMEKWLAAASFRSIDTKLRTVLDPTESIRILIQTNSVLLHRLPWHCWAFLKDYPQAEIAFAAPRFQPVKPGRQIAREKVQILAILGHSKGINIQEDRQCLEQILQAEVTFLVEPQRQEINDCLWERSWDILFFAGHSATKGNRGHIYCNPESSLSLDDFEYGLKQAIAFGLQLAIFNSCDGLGLARSLEKLQFPQLIVMREPVPDWVAQTFLKQLLQSFTTGQTLYQSVRQARERLQGIEDSFPCASWLPILCQNPAVIPPTWEVLIQRGLCPNQPESTALPAASAASEDTQRNRFEPKRLPASVETDRLTAFNRSPIQLRLSRQIQLSLIVSVAVLMLIAGIRHLGWLQPLELKAFDQMMQLRPAEGIDSRLLIVEVTDADIAMQRQNQELLQRRSTSAQTFNQLFDVSLSDDSLNRLLKALASARVIGLDVYRDFAVELDQQALKSHLQTMPQLISVCKAEDFQDTDISSIDAPPEVPIDRIGFSDFVTDEDGVLRRHLLGMLPPLQTPNSRCNVNLSFSVQVAFQFLHQQGMVAQFTPAGDLQLGEKLFPTLRSRSGGYQGITSGGSKLLLNYRSTTEIAPRITLTQLLQNKVNRQFIQNKVVLVGVTASGGEDNWSTPDDASMPGVLAQAHMVSQLIGAALDQRPMLQVWTRWQEVSWMGLWAIAGSILAWRWGGHLLRWGGAIAIASGLLYGFCFSALLKGNWIPFVPSLLVLILASIVLLIDRLRPRRLQSHAPFSRRA